MGSPGHFGEQCFLVRGMSRKNILHGQVDGVAQIKSVAPPRGDVRIQHLLEGIGDPGGRMHAVGDRVDGKLREHLAGDFCMLHGHAVGIAREAQRQQRHVQHSVAKTAQRFQARCAVAAQDAIGLLGVEAVVPGRNRCVGGEDALLAYLLDVGLRGRAQRSAAQLPLQQRQRQQRRVALVHVVDVYLVAQRVRHAHSAHAQHNLLLQAVVGVAAIEVIGQAAISSPSFRSRSVSSR